MKQEIMDFIFNNSKIFDFIRKVIHNDYKDEKKMISSNLEKNKTTLDFGCGIGQFSIMFNASDYYGVDLDPKYIEFCKKNKKGNFNVIKSLPPYPFKKEYFDQILISAVVHHIDKKTLSIISKEFRRILKKDGKLVIIDHYTIKNQKNIFCKLLINIDRGHYFRNPEEIINIFSEEFKLKEMKIFKNGPYKDYLTIFV